VIFNCVTLALDPHSSVSCLYLLNLRTVLIFVNNVGCCQATGIYCIGYCNYGFSVLCIFVNLCILNVCFSCLYFNGSPPHIIFLYIKIHHMYTIAPQRNAYILNIWLLYTMPAAYNSVCFGFMLYYFVWFPDDCLLWTETYRIIKHDIIIHISKEQVFAFGCLSIVNLVSVMHRMNSVKPV